MNDRQIKVLVVEDNPANMAYALFLLKKLHIEARTATSGEAGLLLLEEETVDGMLVDINLGAGMTGVQMMEEVKKNDKFSKIPMVAVTAYYGGGLDKELIEKGFDGFLAKPYNLDQLKDIIVNIFKVNI